jgi:hypothetical protein
MTVYLRDVRNVLGSARILRAAFGILPNASDLIGSRFRQDAATGTLETCAPQLNSGGRV